LNWTGQGSRKAAACSAELRLGAGRFGTSVPPESAAMWRNRAASVRTSTRQSRAPAKYESMKILVVEDEAKTSAHLRKGLGENGFTVDVADTGADGLFLATTGEYDLIVLDVVLPQMDGWSILGARRAAGNKRRVLFLTARNPLPTGSKAWSSARTTIWSSPSHFPNCSPACARCFDADRPGRRGCCALPTWKSTSAGNTRYAAASAST